MNELTQKLVLAGLLLIIVGIVVVRVRALRKRKLEARIEGLIAAVCLAQLQKEETRKELPKHDKLQRAIASEQRYRREARNTSIPIPPDLAARIKAKFQ